MFKRINIEFLQHRDVFNTYIWIEFVVQIFDKTLDFEEAYCDDAYMADVDQSLVYEFLCELIKSQALAAEIIKAFTIVENNNDSKKIKQTNRKIKQVKEYIGRLEMMLRASIRPRITEYDEEDLVTHKL